MRRRARNLRRWLLALCSLPLAVLAGASLVVWLGGLPPSLVRSVLVRVLEDQLQAQVEIGGIEDPIYPSLRLSDVRIRFGDQGEIELPALELDYAISLAGVRAGEPLEVRIASLVLARPRLRWRGPLPERFPPGDAPSDTAPAPASEGPPPEPWLDTRVTLGSIELRDTRISWTPDPTSPSTPPIEAQLELRLDGIDLDAELPLPERAELELRLSPIEIDGRTLGPSEATLELADGKLELRQLHTRADVGELSGSGRLELDLDSLSPRPRAATFALSVANLDLARVSPFEQLRSDLSGEIAAEAEWDAADRPSANFHAHLTGPAAGLPIDALELDVKLHDDALELQSARIRGLAMELEARATAQDPQVLDLRLQVPDLAQLQIPGASLENLSGRLMGAGRVRLDPPSPVGRFELEGTDLVWQDLRARRLALEFEPSAKAATETLALTIDDLLGVRGSARLSVSHAIYQDLLAGKPPSDLEQQLRLAWDLTTTDIGPLVQAATKGAVPIAGGLRARGEALGLTAPPRRLQADLDVEKLELPLKSGERRRVSGHIALGTPGAGGAASSDSSTGSTAESGSAPGSNSAGRSGSAGRSNSTSRSARRSDWALETSVQLTEASGLRLDGRGRVSMAEGGFTPTGFQIEHLALKPVTPGAKGRLSSRGKLGLDRIEDLEVQVEDVAPATWPLAAWMEVPPQLDGSIGGVISLEGSLERPSANGRLDWESPEINGTRAERVRVSFGTDEAGFDLEGTLQALGGRSAKLRVRVPRAQEGESDASGSVLGLRPDAFEASVQTQELDLEVLRPFIPRQIQQAEGRLQVQIQAKGPRARGVPAGVRGEGLPFVTGDVRLEGASMRVPALGQTFKPIDARIEFSQDFIALESLTFATEEGKGRAELTGRIDRGRADRLSARLDARFESLELIRSRRLRLAIDGATSIAGPLDGLEFSGQLALQRARLGAPEESDPIWQEIQVMRERSVGTEVRETSNPLTRAYDQMRGSISLQVPAQTWVRAEGAELELLGRLELRKQAGDVPRFFGDLDVRRGRYQLGPRVLAFERGSAQLTGATELDPIIDVLTTTRIQEYDVSVGIGGRLSDLQLRLSSDPQLERDDILALLLFGRRGSDLEASRANALELVLAQLGSEFGGNELRERLRSYLPFDTFAFELEGKDKGPRVEVGRYLRDDVFVRYEKSLDTEQGSDEVSVEWEVTPSVRVKSETSSDGSTGADIIWEKDY